MYIPKNLLKKSTKKYLLPIDLIVCFLTDPRDLTSLSQVNKNAYLTLSELKFHVVRENKKNTKAFSLTTIANTERRKARIIRHLNGCNKFFQSQPVKLTPNLISLIVGALLLKTSYELINRLDPRDSISREYTAFSLLLGTAMISYLVYWLSKNILGGASWICDDEFQYRLYRQQRDSIKEMNLEKVSTNNR